MHSYVSFFFFKQKTAYEMRISDWSSDVCSSDLRLARNLGLGFARYAGNDARAERLAQFDRGDPDAARGAEDKQRIAFLDVPTVDEIGRASCRERVCQYV